MTLLEFPIRRYPFTLVLFLCLVVLGWFAFSAAAGDPWPRVAGWRRHPHLAASCLGGRPGRPPSMPACVGAARRPGKRYP